MRQMMDCPENARLSRRSLLMGGAASLALWSLIPRIAIAGTRDPRLLTIVLRGGLDGLSMLAPIGDPNYASLRPRLAIPATGEGAGLTLDGFFALNANMPFLHSLYQKREATLIHATATPYRGRSHFDGQDVLESGLGGVGRITDGWMNRALAKLPSAGAADATKGLAMGAVVPLVMRGPAPVLSWIPKTYNLPLRDSTVARLTNLYSMTDPKLARAFAEGLEIDRVALSQASGTPAPAAAKPGGAAGPLPPRLSKEFIDAAEAAARFLSAADGPRIGALSYNGWDTHANEGAVQGQLGNRLAALDGALEALHAGLGPVWRESAIIVMTEFGRTARVNGTEGTDHGTGMAALLVGGAVRGGRIIADWPGLAETSLFEGRDLKPTLDLRTVFKGVLRDHLGIPDGALATSVFPDTAAAKAFDGLMA